MIFYSIILFENEKDFSLKKGKNMNAYGLIHRI